MEFVAHQFVFRFPRPALVMGIVNVTPDSFSDGGRFLEPAAAVAQAVRLVRFNQSFASSTGYVPRSILAMPLLIGERVIGVMEVLDKINAPSFGMQDMDLLGLFARQAAIAIHQFQQYDRLGAALVGGLRRLVSESESPELVRALDGAGDAELEDSLLAIADQFNALSQLGEAEQKACPRYFEGFWQECSFKSYDLLGLIMSG